MGMYQCLKMLVRIRGVEKALVGSAYALHKLVGKLLQTLHTLDPKTFLVAIWM